MKITMNQRKKAQWNCGRTNTGCRWRWCKMEDDDDVPEMFGAQKLLGPWRICDGFHTVPTTVTKWRPEIPVIRSTLATHINITIISFLNYIIFVSKLRNTEIKRIKSSWLEHVLRSDWKFIQKTLIMKLSLHI